jgi:hypothetical protein
MWAITILDYSDRTVRVISSDATNIWAAAEDAQNEIDANGGHVVSMVYVE